MNAETTQKVLVIDDDLNVLELIRCILEQAGFEMVPAASVVAGVSQLQTQAVDLIISDIRLPDSSGLAFLQQLMLEENKIPVIMMTNFGSLQGVETALKYGAKGFISKPLRKDHFLEIVRLVLNGKSMTWEQIVSEEKIYTYFPPPA
jgi:DNA-binding NtrC family response regulator